MGFSNAKGVFSSELIKLMQLGTLRLPMYRRVLVYPRVLVIACWCSRLECSFSLSTREVFSRQTRKGSWKWFKARICALTIPYSLLIRRKSVDCASMKFNWILGNDENFVKHLTSHSDMHQLTFSIDISLKYHPVQRQHWFWNCKSSIFRLFRTNVLAKGCASLCTAKLSVSRLTLQRHSVLLFRCRAGGITGTFRSLLSMGLIMEGSQKSFFFALRQSAFFGLKLRFGGHFLQKRFFKEKTNGYRGLSSLRGRDSLESNWALLQFFFLRTTSVASSRQYAEQAAVLDMGLPRPLPLRCAYV